MRRARGQYAGGIVGHRREAETTQTIRIVPTPVGLLGMHHLFPGNAGIGCGSSRRVVTGRSSNRTGELAPKVSAWVWRDSAASRRGFGQKVNRGVWRNKESEQWMSSAWPLRRGQVQLSEGNRMTLAFFSFVFVGHG